MTLAVLLALGCNERAPKAENVGPSNPSASRIPASVVKLVVRQDGTILVNGGVTSLKALDATLSALSEESTVVWYYRENSRAEPHQNAIAAIDLLAKRRLPISFSSKPDFSDYIDEEGRSHPRK